MPESKGQSGSNRAGGSAGGRVRPQAGRVVLPFKPRQAALIPPSPGVRLKELLSRPDAKAVVRRTSPQDLFLLIKQVGLSDSVELLTLASYDQIQRMIDLDIWDADGIQFDNYVEWLRAVIEAKEQDLDRFFDEIDPELLILFLQEHVRVYVKEEDMPEEQVRALEGKDLVETSDHTFYLEVIPGDELQEFVLAFIERVYMHDLKTAHWMLTAVMAEIPSPMEEQARRLRTGRVEELGFADYEDAQRIYAPLLERDRTPFPAERLDASPGPLAEVPLPVEAFRPGNGSLLVRALEHLRQSRPELDLTHPMLMLANRVIAADGLSPGELEDMKSALSTVRAYVGLGLELEVGEDVVQAAQMLSHAHLEWLFRRGYSEALILRKRAQQLTERMGRLWKPLRSLSADAPWSHHLAGLLKRRALHYQGTGQGENFGPFARRRDLEETAEALHQWAQVLELVFVLLEPEPADPSSTRKSLKVRGGELTPMRIFLTSVVNRLLGGVFSPEPLSGEALQQALPLLFEPGSGAKGHLRPWSRSFQEALAQAILLWKRERGELGLPALEVFLGACLNELRDAYGALSFGERPELKFAGGPLLLQGS